MQGLADGYFVLPYTIGDYLATAKFGKVDDAHPAFAAVRREVDEQTRRLLGINGTTTVDTIHRELGRLMWEQCGMGRTAGGLREAIARVPELRERFWKEIRIPGGPEINQELEKAGRVADFLEFAELMCRDALERDESCGGHFREEHQTPDGEARRDDDRFAHVAVWEYAGPGAAPRRHTEPLTFESVPLAQRSYK
jgi:succinate dehydrogenase / fumarate reductase flavoprotein subunit